MIIEVMTFADGDDDGHASACPQVYIRILDNEWNVYRRYTEFRELHNHLRTQFPQVDTFNFPPKKAIGNKVSSLCLCATELVWDLYTDRKNVSC